MNNFNLNILSSNLRSNLKLDKINVKAISRAEAEANGWKTILSCCIISRKEIYVIIDDVENAGLTADELSCIIWHEYAHVRFVTKDEKFCDDFSIRVVGVTTYNSAINKTRAFRKALVGDKPNDEKYSHRN